MTSRAWETTAEGLREGEARIVLHMFAAWPTGGVSPGPCQAANLRDVRSHEVDQRVLHYRDHRLRVVVLGRLVSCRTGANDRRWMGEGPSRRSASRWACVP